MPLEFTAIEPSVHPVAAPSGNSCASICQSQGVGTFGKEERARLGEEFDLSLASRRESPFPIWRIQTRQHPAN